LPKGFAGRHGPDTKGFPEKVVRACNSRMLIKYV
jgi:hypothetical protein